MEGQSRKNLSPRLGCLFLAHHAGSWWSLSALSIPCPLVQLFFGIQSTHRMEENAHPLPNQES